MAVRRIVRPIRKSTLPLPATVAGVPASQDFPGLPEHPKEPDTNILHYTGLLYGREKIGKTTMMASFPDALFLATEPGTRGQRIYEYNAENGGCKNWDLIRRAVELLEKTDRFKTVVIDTVDRAYDMALDYVCRVLRIDYPGQDDSGREDFGKSWRAVKQEFLSVVHRILQTGRGLWFTSHCREEEIKSRSGETYTRIFPSMSRQARGVVEAVVDMFFYCEYMRSSGPDDQVHRVLVTHGNELVWAGTRGIDGVVLPPLVPLLPEGGFDLLQRAFQGEPVGLDPKTLLPVRGATEGSKMVVRALRRKQEESEPKEERRGVRKIKR